MNDFKTSRRTEHSALSNHLEIKCVKRFKFLGVHTSHKVKKPQQRLYFLRKLKHAHLAHHLPTNFFYQSATESILNYCCTVWFSSTGEHVGPPMGGDGSWVSYWITAACTHKYLHWPNKRKWYFQRAFIPWTLCFPPLPSGRRYMT